MLITVPPDESPERLDKYLTQITDITRSHIQALVERSLVLVNGAALNKPGYTVRPGDEITILDEEPSPDKLVPEDIPLEIYFMDNDLAVVNKPAGMVVYPAPGHARGTLMNSLAHIAPHLATIGGPIRPGVVHRLDKETSGVMVVALTDEAYYSLTEQFRVKETRRKYAALVYGKPAMDKGEISKPIGRATSDRKRMSTHTRRGKEAQTTWKVLERYTGATLIEAILGTGRTHQIRVHMAFMGHPVLGDESYGRKAFIVQGDKKIYFPRQMLHARSLGFRHPRTGEHMEFSSPLPEDMQEAIRSLRGEIPL